MTIKEYFGDWYNKINIKELEKILIYLKTNSNYLCPSIKDIFKAFHLCPFKECKVIMLCPPPYSDIYNNEPRATGIAFGNDLLIPEEDISIELFNIKETVINFEIPHNIVIFDNSLESWAKQGMLLLNIPPTCKINNPLIHIDLWEKFIKDFIKNISKECLGVIFVLVGKQAQSLKYLINSTYNYILEIEHPAYFNKRPYQAFKDIDKFVYNNYKTHINYFKEI